METVAAVSVAEIAAGSDNFSEIELRLQRSGEEKNSLRFFVEVISKSLKNSESLSLRLAKGAFSVITLRVVTLKLPFTTHCEQHLHHFLNDF